MLNALYEEYGKLIVQGKIINNKIQQIEKLISDELNKPVKEIKDGGQTKSGDKKGQEVKKK